VGDLLILEKGKGEKGPRRNPQIHAVITVNADNLLELYCHARLSGAKGKVLTMVDRPSVGDHPDAISVYHLHGILDARDENFRRTDSLARGRTCKKSLTNSCRRSYFESLSIMKPSEILRAL
jgi:hypothetical protein